MRLDINEPLDPVHKRLAAFRTALADWYAQVYVRIQTWEPRPCPDDWR